MYIDFTGPGMVRYACPDSEPHGMPPGEWDSISGLTTLSILPATIPGWSRYRADSHSHISRDLARLPSRVIGMYLEAPVVPLVVVNSTGACLVSWLGWPSMAAVM